MPRVKLTVRLPEESIRFVKRYAASHDLTVTEVIDRYLRRLRDLQEQAIHPEVQKISGILPTDLDGRALYREHAARKHG